MDRTGRWSRIFGYVFTHVYALMREREGKKGGVGLKKPIFYLFF